MKLRDGDLTWEHIHWVWKYFCEVFDSSVVNEPNFLKITRPPHPYLTVGGVDWWPKNQINERREPSPPGYISTGNTKRGTLHTATLLWNAKGDLEKQHAIYILASLWDKEKNLPGGWRGDVYHLVAKVSECIRKRFPDLSRWHHSSKDALPLSLVRYGPGDKMLVPGGLEDLIYIAGVEAVLVDANWQLIEYVSEPSQLRLA